jgi:4-hydroxythreonine-4-phosphate dehydrogenase
MKKPRLVITLGDPAGIGPEIILQALADNTITATSEITVVGSRSVLDDTYNSLAPRLGEAIAHPDSISIIDLPLDSPVVAGQGNAMTGKASFLYLEKAIALTLAGHFDRIVTAPIAKFLWQAAGYNYPGQTEVLAKMAGVDKFGMLFVGRSPFTGWTLRTLLATTHIPLAAVPQTLTPELMTAKLELLINCLQQDFQIEKPTVAIAGLNPHSGEKGKLGTEEQVWLIPWLEQQRAKYPEIRLIGPIPPDTMWVTPAQAWYNPNTTVSPADGYLALYHDQGLIPVKLMAFDYAINTTIGLPFLRTSPDHGTAFDIAGKGIAKATSIKEAIKLAQELSTREEEKGAAENA